MSRYQEHSMEQGQFLTVATNILYKTLIEASRSTAKNVYNAVRDGKRVSLMTVRMDDGTDLRFDLNLDYSEFRGKLNFGTFRASIGQLIAGMGEVLKAEKELTVFSEENNASVMFGLPAVTEEEGKVNVLMLGADTRSAGSVLLKLMYVDPEQFAEDNAAEG